MNKQYSNNFSASSVSNNFLYNNDELNYDISAEEMVKALKSLKNNKASG